MKISNQFDFPSVSLNHSSAHDSFLSILIPVLSISFVAAFWWNLLFSFLPIDLAYIPFFLELAVVIFFTFLLCQKAGIKGLLLELFGSALFLWYFHIPLVSLLCQISDDFLLLFSNGIPYRTIRWISIQKKDLFSGVLLSLVSLPLVMVWILAFQKRRGVFFALFLLLLPFLVCSATNYLPNMLPVALLLASFLFYLAARRGFQKSSLCFLPLLTLILLFSFRSGISLNLWKTSADSFYPAIRTAVRLRIDQSADQLTKWLLSSDTAASTLTSRILSLQPDSAKTELSQNTASSSRNENSPADSLVTPPKDARTLPPSIAPAPFSSSENALADSYLDTLDSLSCFAPDDSVSFSIVRSEQPSSTVYVPTAYGTAFSDDTWTIQTEEPDNTDAFSSFYTFPDSLNQLQELSDRLDAADVDTLTSEICSALQSRAVYDTNPGAVPFGSNFIEYFLFENQKGFCVHFATTATILYRMHGVAACYVKGYAVPASAFSPGEDGRYYATVTGQMGHAWCETWNTTDASWTIREHTPAAAFSRESSDRTTANNPNSASSEFISSTPEPSAQPVQKNTNMDTSLIRAFTAALARLLKWLIPVLLPLLLFLLQARLRRLFHHRQMQKRLKNTSPEQVRAAVGTIYLNILKLCRLAGTDTVLSPELPDEIPEAILQLWPQIPREDWESFYSQILQTFFYYDRSRGELQSLFSFYYRFLRIAKKELPWGKRFYVSYILALL